MLILPPDTGLIYVVDSADRERFSEAKRELFNVLDTHEMTGVPVVIVANKQDMPGKFRTSKTAD